MNTRITFVGLSLAVLLGLAAGAPGYTGSPMLDELVSRAVLPDVEERLPTTPRVLAVEGEGLEPGRHGGEIHLLMGRNKDVRLMVVYGYSRLVGYNKRYELVPDIVESLENEGDRAFTFHLRAGHKWSDGQPFTSAEPQAERDPDRWPHPPSNNGSPQK